VNLRAATLVLLLPAAPLAAQPSVPDPLLHWMDSIAQRQLDEREKIIAGIHAVAQAEARKQWVRARLLEVLGGLPDYNGPLNARITGRLENDSYTVEKVIFESLPGYYVTADLYRPNRPGRYPAVLLPPGHTQAGKTEPKQIAANLAAKGFVALAYDPVGQGEREQTYDRKLGRPLGGWSVNEHMQNGEQCILIGESVARYFIWDSKRAVDYLLTRPDVDGERIGCAGCSGGGTQTTYVGAFDPRVKAVAPACYINSYRLLFAGPDPDSEMSLPHFLAAGLDMADFVELSAPLPWLILSTEHDYFSPAGAKMVYDEARRWYQLYGAEDRVRFFVGPGPHGTPRETREQIYAWMIRWLKHGEGDAHEQDVKIYSDKELLVTPTGRVEDEPGSRKLYQFILDDFHRKKRQGTIPELQAELRRLQVPSGQAAPAVRIVAEPGGRQRLTFETEPGLEIGGALYVPHAPGRKAAVLLVADDGAGKLAEEITAAGRVVLVLEPRDAPSEYDNRPFLGNWLPNARADVIGRNLPAMRAHDILRGVDLLAARADVDRSSIRAAARGVKGIWLLLAAAADGRIGKIWLDRTPYSLRAALESPMNTDLYDAVIPGFALHWDLSDLVRAVGERPVLWTDPVDWMGSSMALGPGYRYRQSGEPDAKLVEEFLR